MSNRRWSIGLVLMEILALAGLVLSQDVQQSGTLTVTGKSGQAAVLQINGKSFVDIEALARLVRASVTSKGNQITMTLPATAASPRATPIESAVSAFSKDFLKAGIEEMTVIREWRSSLLNAIRDGYPVTNDLVTRYRDQASKGLKLAFVAVSTDADRDAFQLLSHEFDNMQKFSDKILTARKNMNYISRDALKDDPMDQQILTCARALASMAASGVFQDDGSCH